MYEMNLRHCTSWYLVNLYIKICINQLKEGNSWLLKEQAWPHLHDFSKYNLIKLQVNSESQISLPNKEQWE